MPKVKFHQNRQVFRRGYEMAVLAYVLVTLQSGSEANVLENVASFEEVKEVDLVYGEFDAVVKVLVEEMSQLDKFLTDKLRVLPDIYLTTTMIVARQYKQP
jgi:DNA-binding Lrp family transcriptional regulator